MAAKKGFSLLEMIVTIVIVGVAAAFAIPNFVTSMEKSKAQAAQNNLYALIAAQQKYFEDFSNYCLVACGDSTANINTHLHLELSDSFAYSCNNTTLPYICTAADGTDTLTLNPSLQPPVSCAGPNSNYCP